MGLIVDSTFGQALSVGLGNYDNAEFGLETAVNNTTGGFTNLFNATGSNPTTPPPSSGFSAVGSVLEPVSQSWTSNENGQGVEQMRIRVEQNSGAGFNTLAVWNNGGAGFGETAGLGDDVNVSGYHIECVRAGIAEALDEGNNNKANEVHLLDTNGNRINEGWSSKTDPQTFNATASALSYTDDVEFTNTTGSTKTVGGVEVVYANSQNLVITDESLDIPLDSNDSLVFTTLEVQLTLP